MSNFQSVRLQLNPETEVPTFLMKKEDESFQIEAEDEQIYIIRGMLVEYLDGMFYGMAERVTVKDARGNVADTDLIPTGLSFTPHEIDQILFFMEGDIFIAL